MFVGRTEELNSLNRLYDEGIFQCIIIYGRRRVGKTTLISHFMKDKPGIFFTAQEILDHNNLEEFSKHIYEFFNVPLSAGAFQTWNAAFAFIAEKAMKEQFILAFDEFPYAAKANPALKSILQNIIDHKLKDSKLYLILCGSHESFMEKEVLGIKSPLFGRRTAQLRIEGFDYQDAFLMLDGFSIEDKFKIYASIGGTPHYLSQVKKSENYEENIKRLYFDISGYLYNEPMMLLMQEVREPAAYNSIIAAIASGASKLNEIVTKTGEERTKISKYLTSLVGLKIVIKEYPFGENPENSRKSIYRLNDFCYNFWYRFVLPARPEIESGNGAEVADEEVFSEQLSDYIGKPPFEEICLQYLKRQNKKKLLPFSATSFGKWWGTDPKEKKETDIDVIAANRRKKQILLGECKWRNSFDDVAEIKKLMEKDYLLPEYNERYYYLFSKVPFSKNALLLKEENPRLKLITIEDIVM